MNHALCGAEPPAGDFPEAREIGFSRHSPRRRFLFRFYCSMISARVWLYLRGEARMNPLVEKPG